MDNRAVLGKFLDFSGDAVIKANAQGKEEIRFIDGTVGVNRSMHPKPLQRKWVPFRKTTDPHQCRGDRYLASLSELEQFTSRIRGYYAPSGINHRSFRRFDQADDFIQRHRIRSGWQLISA